MSGRDVLYHGQLDWSRLGGAPHVGPAYRVAVHGGVGPGGHVERTDDVEGEDAIQRVVQGNPERRLPADVLQNPERCVASGVRQISNAFSQAMLASNWSHMVSRKCRTGQWALNPSVSVTMATQCSASGDVEE